jgi:hypothetical protein
LSGKDALFEAAVVLLPAVKFCRSYNIGFDSFHYYNSCCGFATVDCFLFYDFGIAGFANNYLDFASCGFGCIERSRLLP